MPQATDMSVVNIPKERMQLSGTEIKESIWKKKKDPFYTFADSEIKFVVVAADNDPKHILTTTFSNIAWVVQIVIFEVFTEMATNWSFLQR